MMSVKTIFCYLQHVAISTGIGKGDLEKMRGVLEAIPDLTTICVDVANGYSETFVKFVKQVRSEYPSHTILVCIIVHFFKNNCY